MSVACRHTPSGIVDRDDLKQLARIALWRAWVEYDPDGGASFKTWAYHKVRGAILHEFRDTSGVPGGAYEKGVRVTVYPVMEDTPEPVMEEAGYAAAEWSCLLDVLPERERRVVALCGPWGLTQAEAGAALHLCQGMVSLLRRQGLDRLRAAA
jgi:RNA polymerase sigma factor (sigma-70 family)